MSLIVGLECSSSFLSVALQEDDKFLFSSVLFLEQAQARMSASLINACIKSIDRDISQVSAIAIGKGPGSYTGLRIGVSLAKGLCSGLGVPLISISAMDNMAYQIQQKYLSFDVIVTVLDARRDEVYFAAFLSSGENVVATQALKLQDIQFLKQLRGESVLLGGSGAKKCLEFFLNPPKWQVDSEIQPDAATTCAIAYEKWKNKNFEDPASFVPDYIKPVFITSGN